MRTIDVAAMTVEGGLVTMISGTITHTPTGVRTGVAAVVAGRADTETILFLLHELSPQRDSVYCFTPYHPNDDYCKVSNENSCVKLD